ncbi:MAG: ankyrin repeat domain-containing protein, partial [Bacteroidetes bacterium]
MKSPISSFRLFIALFLLGGLMACQPTANESTSGSAPQAPSMSLHEAVFMGDLKAVEGHIAAGTDLDAVDAYGSTPLNVATTFGKTEVALRLIEAGADVNAPSSQGATPLHTAAFLCRTEIVEALLAKEADQNVRNDFGATPLESVSGSFASAR